MTTSARRKDASARSRRDAVINLRLARQTRDLIDSAAQAAGKSRSEFIVESARKSATDVLLDQRFFALDTRQFKRFATTLDRPPAPNQKLRELFAKQAPWER